jgi:hypothetical protein
MKRVRGWVRYGVIVVSVIILTSITVDATMSPSGFSQSALGILASRAVPEPTCPDGMAVLSSEGENLCVDQFEASPALECPMQSIHSVIDTRSNIDAVRCAPHSREGVLPWTFVTFHQASELCAKEGKRLPTAVEWYRFALGTPDRRDVCNTSSDGLVAGDTNDACVNAFGIYHAIGNAWEWVDGTVRDGTFDGRTLPESGYVVQADRSGMATLTHPDTPNQDLHEDYFWSESSGEYGILRGGFYGSGTDGGLYGVQAKTPLSLSSAAIGFRCVLTL